MIRVCCCCVFRSHFGSSHFGSSVFFSEVVTRGLAMEDPIAPLRRLRRQSESCASVGTSYVPRFRTPLVVV